MPPRNRLSYEIKKYANTKTRQDAIVFGWNHSSRVFGHTGEDKGGDRVCLLIVRPFTGCFGGFSTRQKRKGDRFFIIDSSSFTESNVSSILKREAPRDWHPARQIGLRDYGA